MKYGLDVSIAGEFADLPSLIRLAIEAEQARWNGFFLQDYLISDQPVVDPWIALSAIATQTHKIRLGVLMTALPRRRAWIVARQTVTLDRLSKGRLIFGAGLGFNPFDFEAFGENAELRMRAEKLDEGLTILTGLWTGESFQYQGKYYQVKQTQFLPRPVQSPRIPIWIAGSWPNRKPFQRAAHWDGVYVMTKKVNGTKLTPTDIAEIIAYIRTQRKSKEPFEVAYADETSLDTKESRAIVKSYGEAGVTWWLEGIWNTMEEGIDRIHSGPPGY